MSCKSFTIFLLGVGCMLKFSKTIINPFDYINPETVRNTVNTLKDLHPEWEKEDICRELIAKKARLCGGSGALAALPSSIPGLGTLVTVIGGTAVDITFLVYFLSELMKLLYFSRFLAVYYLYLFQFRQYRHFLLFPLYRNQLIYFGIRSMFFLQ